MGDRSRVLELFEANKFFFDTTVAEGIERHRKGDAVIKVVDGEGKPISGTSIKLSQKTHEFRFGANIFMLDELETPEKNELYKQYFKDIFNMATLPFYWDTLEPEKGKPRFSKDSSDIYRRPPIDRCLEFCEENGIEPREHALAFDLFFPKWLYGESVETIKAELERRCKEIAERYADRIPTIEVTNEMDHKTGKTAFYDKPDFVEYCFKLAEKYFPNNQLGINEVTRLSWQDNCRTSDKYYSYIEANMLKGSRIDAIGMQYHMFHKSEVEYEKTRAYYDPLSLYRHMDMYFRLGKPLQVTEITIPAYSWEPEDEEIQAKIIEYLYSIWFSHPGVEQIVYWNVVDGYAHVWTSDLEKIRESQGNMTIGENYYHGGLLRFDMTPKPAFHKIRELIKERWHTEESLSANEKGEASFRGFYGKYEVTVTAGGKTQTVEIDLSKGKDSEFIITL